MKHLPNKERLEAIAYGSVRQSQDEGVFMARVLLAGMQQDPTGLRWRWNDVDAEWTYAAANKMPEFIAAGFTADNGVEIEYIYTHPATAHAMPDESQSRELFEVWFADDCSFDRSPQATDADNYAWKESLWYTWEKCRAAMFNGHKL